MGCDEAGNTDVELRVPLTRAAGMWQNGEEELHGHLVFSSWERQRRIPRQIILGKCPVLEIPILKDHVATHWGLALRPVPEPDVPMIARGTLTTLPDPSEIAAAAAALEPMPTIAENAVASEESVADAAGANLQSAAADAADDEGSSELDPITYESTNAMITSGDIPIIIFGPGGVIAHSFPEEEFPMFMDKVVYNRILSKEIDPAQEPMAREHMARRGVDMEAEFKAPEHLEYRKNNPDPEEEAYRKWWWSALKGRKLSEYTLNQHEVGFTLRTEEEIDAFVKKFCQANPHYAMKTQCQTFVKSLHAFLACDALGGLRSKSIDGFLDAVVGWSVLAGLLVAAEILSGPVSVGAVVLLASQKFSQPH